MMDFKYSNIWQRLADFYLSSFFHLLFLLISILILIQLKLLEFSFFLPEFWTKCFWIFVTYHLLETCIEGITGSGLAKQILGMRLLSTSNSKPIGIVRALFRTILALFSFLFFGLGFIAIAFNREHKSLHDLLTGTKVVNIPKQGFLKFISVFWTVLSLAPGLVLTIALLGTFSTVPLGATKSLINLSKPSTFQLESFNVNPELKISLPFQQKRLSALTELNNFEYIEYNIDPLSEYNYIQPDVLRLLGVKFSDYDFLITDWQEDITQAKIKTAILIPKLTFKDQDDKDITVFNQKFLIDASRTVLGNEFLDLFDYQINNQTMIFALYSEDQEILKDQNLDIESKNYLLHVLREIRAKWRDYQAQFPAKELEEFAKVEEKLTSLLELDFDTKDGYIKSAVITEPTKNEVFNSSCKKFVKVLPKFTNIPDVLKQRGTYKVKISLTYREILDH